MTRDELIIFPPDLAARERLRVWLSGHGGYSVPLFGIHVETARGPIEFHFDDDLWGSYDPAERSAIERLSPNAVPVLFEFLDISAGREFLSTVPEAGQYLVDDESSDELSVVSLQRYLLSSDPTPHH